MTRLPLVTIIMPVRNEAAYIQRSLGAVLAQTYPADHLEVMVVDGMSDDGTRPLVKAMARESSIHVELLDNPDLIVPPAFNRGLARAAGEMIIRVDGHCEIAPDYVECCIAALHETGADCVGGAMVTVGETAVAGTIATAQSSSFGVGGATFRVGSETGRYVDTIAFGAYRRDVFDRIGGYDEELVRNQDDEFNFRLIQSGGKIWLDPSIHSVYYSRASFRKLWRQYYQYGFYKVRVIQKRGGVPSLRHLVPALFVLGLIVTLLAALLAGRRRLALLIPLPYMVAAFTASVSAARGRWWMLPLLPIAYLTLHLAYGVGFLHGVWHWREGFHKSALSSPSEVRRDSYER